MTTFDGFGPKVKRWFQGLEADNSREYFAAHRDVFEESVRDQMEALLTELSQKFGGDVKLFRQNRDIRFSPDKSPYKTNTYGIVHGSELAAQGLYASISARGLVAGSGYHVMARDQRPMTRAGPSSASSWTRRRRRGWRYGARASPPRRAATPRTTSASNCCDARAWRSATR